MISSASRVGSLLLRFLARLGLLFAIGWAALALWIDGPAPRPLAAVLTAAVTGGCLFALIWIRPFARAAAGVILALLLVYTWWLSIPPRNDRDWMPDVARLAHVNFDGNRVTIENVRNFDYSSETDFTERWEERAYDLDQVIGVDLFLSFWGPTLIAHTIASWEFADGRHLAISIETRKEKGESYSALRGFFRQYELYYVVADERDVVGVRTNFRGERVYLYRMRMRPDRARALLVDYLQEVNRLVEQPKWYNALSHNCTTTIRHHAQQVAAGRPFDWRILANGYLDELGYERGQIDTSLPFAELRKRSDITERARAAGNAPDFSARIRVGLPGAERGSSESEMGRR